MKVGNPRIEYYDAQRVTSSVDWNIGSKNKSTLLNFQNECLKALVAIASS